MHRAEEQTAETVAKHIKSAPASVSITKVLLDSYYTAGGAVL